jgi:hypothetical protein
MPEEYGSYPAIEIRTVWDFPASSSRPTIGVVPVLTPSISTEAPDGVEEMLTHPTWGIPGVVVSVAGPGVTPPMIEGSGPCAITGEAMASMRRIPKSSAVYFIQKTSNGYYVGLKLSEIFGLSAQEGCSPHWNWNRVEMEKNLPDYPWHGLLPSALQGLPYAPDKHFPV